MFSVAVVDSLAQVADLLAEFALNVVDFLAEVALNAVDSFFYVVDSLAESALDAVDSLAEVALDTVNSLTEFVVNMIYLVVEVFETHVQLGETGIGSNRQYPHRGVGRRLALVLTLALGHGLFHSMAVNNCWLV